MALIIYILTGNRFNDQVQVCSLNNDFNQVFFVVLLCVVLNV